MINVCFICGRPAARGADQDGALCRIHDRKISSPTAEILRTRPGQKRSDNSNQYIEIKDGAGGKARKRRSSVPV
jgi:hypothetical protein